MPKLRSLGALAMALLLPLGGCSLMSLDDFDARPCASDADCARARDRAGLDPRLCGHCLEGLCDFQHRFEVCNGEDDDCNGLIDENIAVESRPIMGPRTSIEAIEYTTAPVGPRTTYVAIGGPSPRGYVITEDGQVVGPTTLRYDSAWTDGDKVCPSATLLSQPGPSGCNIEQLALAADSQHLVYATINTQGCASGQLRVGLADREVSPFTIWLGNDTSAESPGNIDLGVDVGREGGDYCSGATIADRMAGSARPGARNPAIASLGTTAGGAGALATWLAASHELEASTCNSVLVPVHAIGLYVPEGGRDPLLGTDGGKPIEIGFTTSLAPPSVVPLNFPPGTANYLVGFASEEQGERGVRLISVARREDRLEFETVTFIQDAFAAEVTLAVGAVSELGPEVALAWSAACDERSSVRFTSTTMLLSKQQQKPITLQTERLLTSPQLLYRSQGFAESTPSGGWLVLWADQRRSASGEVQLARVRAGTHEILNRVTLASGTLAHPLLLPQGTASLTLALVEADDGNGEPVETFPEWCDVRD